MYIVAIGCNGCNGGKKYLQMYPDASHWDWVRTFKHATRFKTYVEAKDAMRLAVKFDNISDATIYGYY